VAVQVTEGLLVDQNAHEFAFLCQSKLRHEELSSRTLAISISLPISFACSRACFVFCRSDDAISVLIRNAKIVILRGSMVSGVSTRVIINALSLQHPAEQPHLEERAVSPSTSFFGRLLLDVDTSLEVRTFINGDALGRDVARDNGRLL